MSRALVLPRLSPSFCGHLDPPRQRTLIPFFSTGAGCYRRYCVRSGFFLETDVPQQSLCSSKSSLLPPFCLSPDILPPLRYGVFIALVVSSIFFFFWDCMIVTYTAPTRYCYLFYLLLTTSTLPLDRELRVELKSQISPLLPRQVDPIPPTRHYPLFSSLLDNLLHGDGCLLAFKRAFRSPPFHIDPYRPPHPPPLNKTDFPPSILHVYLITHVL